MPRPESPCVRNCCLQDDVCLGCHRHIDEIIGWGSADDEARADILSRAKDRARVSAQRSGSNIGPATG